MLKVHMRIVQKIIHAMARESWHAVQL